MRIGRDDSSHGNEVRTREAHHQLQPMLTHTRVCARRLAGNVADKRPGKTTPAAAVPHWLPATAAVCRLGDVTASRHSCMQMSGVWGGQVGHCGARHQGAPSARQPTSLSFSSSSRWIDRRSRDLTPRPPPPRLSLGSRESWERQTSAPVVAASRDATDEVKCVRAGWWRWCRRTSYPPLSLKAFILYARVSGFSYCQLLSASEDCRLPSATAATAAAASIIAFQRRIILVFVGGDVDFSSVAN